MSRSLFRLCVVALLALSFSMVSSLASGQGATAPLSGVVVDKDGGVMPGVTVVVKDNASGANLPAVVTNEAGLFTVASLNPGAYTVTVSLTGFKTAVVNDVRVTTGVPANIGKVTLDVGQISETIEVTANAEVVQTQATAITSTLSSNQIKNLPLITKNVLNFVTFLPGVDTGGTHSQRASTVAGLPQNTLAISIDGVNSQDNFNKSTDGFFSIITPSVDAIEEVTVSTATPGADASGQGAVQIKFVTRSGTNKYAGSIYEYYRHPKMNANSFFNIVNKLAKNNIVLHQYGGNIGGPIVLPGYNGRGKAFFFQNMEEFYQPSEITRTRVVMNSDARNGIFTYTAAGATQRINVLDVGAAGGYPSTMDPMIRAILAEIATASSAGGSLTVNTDPNTSNYVYNAPSKGTRHFPTTRLDFNLSQKNRLSLTYYYQKFNSDPDLLNSTEPKFPGLPSHGAQFSHRNQASATYRSTLTPNMVSETVAGLIWSPVNFFADATPAQFTNQGGYALQIRGGTVFNDVTIPTAGGNTASTAFGNNISARNGWDWSIDQKLNWQNGKHSWQFGGSFIQVKGWVNDQQLVPAVTFGVDQTNDPSNAIFTTTNFPGASNAQLGDARFLYGMLTGRVSSIVNQLAIDGGTGEYVNNGMARRTSHMNEFGFYAQDAWRIKPNLTLNYGLRYELQMPISPESSVWSMATVADACGLSGTGNGFGTLCNIYKPGTLTGVTPTYKQYTAGTKGYNTDYNNLAPSVGVAWLPNVQGGILRGILGDPDQATIRASYARSFIRDGLGRLQGPFETNPGVFIAQTRSQNNGNLVFAGEQFPLLLRETGRMGPAPFAAKPTYPLPIQNRSNVGLFDPDFKVGYVDSYSLGFQRSLSRDAAFEIRYIGTRGKDLFEAEAWNGANIVENGFLDEFKNAQRNLYANIAGGRGQTIAYFGSGTGTVPLPVYLGYFTGNNASLAGDPTRYTGTNWTNATLVGRFAQLNPRPDLSATDLQGDATRRNSALTAGLASNFFTMNPDVGNVTVSRSKQFSRYNSVQMNYRRRLANGFSFDANYTFSKRWISRLDSLRVDRYLVRSTDEVPHAFKLGSTWDLPIGRGRRFGTDMNVVSDALAGGWSVNLTGKIQSGQVQNFGDVRIVGMTPEELQDSVGYYTFTNTAGATRVYYMPLDIVENTIRAFSINTLGYTAGAPNVAVGTSSGRRYLAPANGPDCITINRGDCGARDIFVTAPAYTRFDFSMKKAIRTGGRTNLVVEFDVLNLFNAINFNPVISTSTTADDYRVTSSYSDVNGTFDPGSRVGQLVLRFNF
jgi:hypothetical protein